MDNSVYSLTELPLGLPGKIYRSPMPFGPYDAAGIVFEAYKSHHVSVVVVLAEDEECLHKAKRNLHAFYAQEGLEVIHCPIRDFQCAVFHRPANARSVGLRCAADLTTVRPA